MSVVIVGLACDGGGRHIRNPLDEADVGESSEPRCFPNDGGSC